MSVYDNLLFLSDNDCKFNTREKLYISENGELLHRNVMFVNKPIFNSGVVLSEFSEKQAAHEEFLKNLDEEYNNFGAGYKSKFKGNPIERAKRRARNTITDYVLCGNFDCFLTLTLGADKVKDRSNYNEIVKKLNTFLGHKVQRYNLRYVGVAELHKKGGIHFHLLCNAAALQLVDSGTVSVPLHKKPIKKVTADRYGIPLEDRHTVYNVPSWKYGFTTAIMLYGDNMAVARYVCKYITKSDVKVGGRWYYSGGKLIKPTIKYSSNNFDDVTDFDYDYDYGYGKIKFRSDDV